MNKNDILNRALSSRHDEVLGYQIDIDNFRLAIAKIEAEHNTDSTLDLAMQEFSKQLAQQLESSLIEQRKAQIILEVIESQLES